MTDTAPPARESTTCAKCGLTDTHSMHIQYVAFTHPVSGEGVDLSVTKHVQCCAEDGCPICAIDVEFADQQPQINLLEGPGDAFTDFMTSPRSEAHLQALFERQNIESPNYSFGTTQEVTGG